MLKRLSSILLCCLLTLTTITGSFLIEPTIAYALPQGTSNAEVEQEANALKELGLFLGYGNNDFGLENPATRAHGIVMLIRILGEEKEALAYTGNHPFKDVPAWCDRYVAYAYNKGYTNGTSATTYSPNNTITGQQYIVFLLRALGYTEKSGDFTYATAVQKAKEIGLINNVNDYSGNFLRKDIVHLSYTALTTYTKSGIYLSTQLTFKNPTVEFFTALVKYGLTEDFGNGNMGGVTPEDPSDTGGGKIENEMGDTPNIQPGEFKIQKYYTTNFDVASNKNFNCSLKISNNKVTATIKTTAEYESYMLLLHKNGQWGYVVDDMDSTTYTPGSTITLQMTIPSGSESYAISVQGTAKNSAYTAYVTNIIPIKNGGFELTTVATYNAGKRMSMTNTRNYLKDRNGIDATSDVIMTASKEITSGATSNTDKAMKIYEWITKNVKYGTTFSSKASDVYLTKFANCSGYSNLMAALLNAQGIPARIMVGESTLVAGMTGFSGSETYVNHEWVEFYNGSRWVICDPTMGSMFNEKTSRKAYEYNYFDMTETYADSVMKISYAR